jgi:glutathione peroxidase
MMTTALNLMLGIAMLAGSLTMLSDRNQSVQSGSAGKADPFVLNHHVKQIDGTPVDLRHYKGKVVMIVNVASRCGLTPQYKELQALYEEHKEQGFEILGFPANNFGAQEPGTNSQIAEFCSATYGVTFPMFGKISVKGETTHPLYRQLAAQEAPIGGEPAWNFTKFLLNRQGEVVARFEPRTKPDADEVTAKLSELLSSK